MTLALIPVQKSPVTGAFKLYHRVCLIHILTTRIMHSGEKASRATSEAQNKDRAIGVSSALARKKVGTKVDFLFSAPLCELGAAEAGASSDRSSTKSIVELGLKCPKTLKDMLVELERLNEANIREYKMSGFVMSGMI